MLRVECNRFPWVCVLLAIFSLLLLQFNRQATDVTAPSSVWCKEHSEGLQCSFQNLYYHPEENFIFYLTPESIVSGLRDPSLLNRIQTTTVANHSEFYLKLETRTRFNLARVRRFERKLFFVQRFKPDNLLHVIHDDLLPLHATYQLLCFGKVDECTLEYQLALIDTNPGGSFVDWYAHFSQEPPVLFSELEQEWFQFCDVKIGLLNKIVYQYGIGRVHGPVESELRGGDILAFRDFILSKYPAGKKVRGVTLIRRRQTRKILNENYLVNLVESNLKLYGDLKVNAIDLLANSSSEAIEAVNSSSILIVMHGAETILSLFLPTNSSVVELFPFGIDKHFVSPLFSYSRVKDIHFRYFSWTNTNEYHTVTHPDNPPLFGGIHHLNTALQREIEETKTVPPVVCCHNPLYLFRMFQDTYVDQTIEPVVAKALDSIRTRFESNKIDYMRWFVPGKVRKLHCLLKSNRVILHWEPPKNVMNFKDARFDIVLSVNRRSEVFRTKFNNFTMQLKHNFTILAAWVCTTLWGNKGKDDYVECNK